MLLLDNLVPVLMQTFTLVMMGYIAARRKIMPPAGASGLGRFAATFALSASVLQNIATLNLGAASPGVVLGLLAAKCAVAAIVGGLTFALVQGDTRSWSLAALFAMVTTSQSDFAIGLPILDALYPPPLDCQRISDLDQSAAVGNQNNTVSSAGATACDDEAELAFSDYLYIGAPNSLLVINPVCFALLELANAVSRGRRQQQQPAGPCRDDGATADVSQSDSQQLSIGCCFVVRQVLIPTLTSPVVMSVFLGIIINISGAPLPVFADKALHSVGAAYPSLALFCLGYSISTNDAQPKPPPTPQQHQQQAEPSSSAVAEPVELVAPESAAAQAEQVEPEFGWVQPALLIAAKSVLLPVLARIIVLHTTSGSEEYSRFAFVYGTFPASPSVALFAAQYGMPKDVVRQISITTIVGTVASAPIVLATAQMATAQGDAAAMTRVLQSVEEVGWGSLVGSIWVLIVSSSMLLSWATPGWRRQYLVWSVFFLALSQVVYLTLTAVCTPKKFQDKYPAQAEHCTLAIETFSTGARIWGVILLIADVHRMHRHAATGTVWRGLRAGKSVILWSAWLLPGLWGAVLWASGLWEEMNLACFSCYSVGTPSKATNLYRLWSSLLSTILAAIALGVLVWARLQSHPRSAENNAELRSLDEPLVSTGISSAMLPLGSSMHEEEAADGVPTWLSVQIRVVGLCNLLGLLFQAAVGVSTLLSGAASPSNGEAAVEILALNRKQQHPSHQIAV